MLPVRPKEGRWIARPRKARWVTPAVAFIVFSTQIPNWFNTFLTLSGRSHAGLILSFVLIGFFLLVAVALLVKYALSFRLGPRDKVLLDDSFGEQFLVEVTIVSGKVRFGTDRGVLWFSDGLMGFSGAATSFVLSAADIELQARAKRRDGRLPHDAIVLRGSPRPGYFVIHPIGKGAKEYLSRLNLFMACRDWTDSERIWPPLEPYSETKVIESSERTTLGR